MHRQIWLMILMFPLAASSAVFADDAAKKIFTDNKCTTCHSIESAGLKSTMGDKSPAAKAGMGDLSDVGSLHPDPAWIMRYLTKKENQKEKPHPKAFTGTEADLKKLAEWLASLKKKK